MDSCNHFFIFLKITANCLLSSTSRLTSTVKINTQFLKKHQRIPPTNLSALWDKNFWLLLCDTLSISDPNFRARQIGSANFELLYIFQLLYTVFNIYHFCILHTCSYQRVTSRERPKSAPSVRPKMHSDPFLGKKFDDPCVNHKIWVRGLEN